ncbi:hypothetical protein ACFQPF_12080 [Fictibacillus iocasae]|uniref:ABC transmembrane type-1 domain-containing protein n=1 Tax=Fictibacillus iocasae TaxID=2715437 RepID=A0ABW2NSP2_9BACL
MMAWKVVKQPSFLIGFLFIAGLLTISFTFERFYQVPEKVEFLYNDQGFVSKVAPFSPSDVPPFGTDRRGQSMFHLILDGAKYTVLFAAGIAVLRIALSVLISFFYYRMNTKTGSFIEDLVESSIYMPTAILAFILMEPLFMADPSGGFRKLNEIVTLQFLILTGIGVLPLISFFSKDIKSIMKKDYITNTVALGASLPYVYVRHVLPELVTKCLVLTAQNMIQVLIILCHLGVLSVFIGGAEVLMEGDPMEPTPAFYPIAGEWSGLIGLAFRELQTAPWLVLLPLAFFAATIYALNLIMQGIQNVRDAK